MNNNNSQDRIISEDSAEDLSENILNILNPIIVRKRLFLIISSLTILIGFGITIRNRIINPVYIGNFSILVSDPLQINNEVSNKESQLIQNLAMNNSQNNIPTLIEFMKSTLAIKPIAMRFNISPNELKSRLIIENSIKNRFSHTSSDGVLTINLYSKDPKNDLPLLKALSNHYLRLSSTQRQTRLKEGLDFLNSQEPLLQEKTINLQSELVAFRKENSLIEPIIEGTALKERQNLIKNELLKLELNQKKIESVKKGIISGTLTTTGFKEAISIESNNGGLIINDFDKSIVEELLIAESELAKALSKYQEKSVIVKTLKRRINQIKPIIISKQLNATDTALTLNQERMINLKNQLSDIEDLFQLQPDLIKKYNTLKQNLEIAQKNLLGLVSARESFQLKIAQSRVPWQIIEPPRMGNRVVQPRIKRSFAISIFLAVTIGGLITFLRDKLDNFFHNVNEVNNFTDLPILGNLPYISQMNDKQIGGSEEQTYQAYLSNNENNEDIEKNLIFNRFISQEALRNIYSSIRFLNADNQIKTICITSSVSGEGKSLINIFLTKTIAEIDKKVLLVDADLRRSQIHKRLRLNNLKGLSNYLTTPGDQNINDYIQSVENIPNLKVITAGKCPPNSAQLLNSKKMEKFIKKLKEDKEFEYIFFDTPPILGIADTSLLANKIDAFFLIVTLNNITKNFVDNSLQRSNIAGTKIQGIITNSIKENKISTINGKYGSYYNTNYNYNYGFYSNYLKNDNNKNSEKESLNKNEEKYYPQLFKGNIKSNIVNLIKSLINWIDK